MALAQGKVMRTRHRAGLDAIRAFMTARRDLPVLAVLPFGGPPGTGTGQHLAEGAAEMLIQGLSRVEGLRVFSRATSFFPGAAGADPVEAGRRLRADLVLSGSVRPFSGGIHLEASLLDVGSGRSLLEEALESSGPGLPGHLASLAGKVAAALGLPPPLWTPAGSSPEAYACYLKGRRAYFRFNRQGMAEAADLFQKAVDLAPDYAAAWAGLADCAAYAYIYIQRAEEQRDRADACSRRALELDPDLAEAHASRGLALSGAGLNEEAEACFERAIYLDPNLYEAAYFCARHCFATGNLEMAVQFFEHAAAIRPEDFQAVLLVAQVYHSLGIEEEAAAARRRGLALVEKRLERDPEDARARYMGANALVALGERERGLQWARLARDLDPGDTMLLYNLGCIHALAGDQEEAMACLEAAVKGGLTQKGWFLNDSDLDSLRDLPRFRKILDSL